MPRLESFKEHINSHQFETVQQFRELGLAIEIDYPIKLDSLRKMINEASLAKSTNKDIENSYENSLIESIKEDVKRFLDKDN